MGDHHFSLQVLGGRSENLRTPEPAVLACPETFGSFFFLIEPAAPKPIDQPVAMGNSCAKLADTGMARCDAFRERSGQLDQPTFLASCLLVTFSLVRLPAMAADSFTRANSPTIWLHLSPNCDPSGLLHSGQFHWGEARSHSFFCIVDGGWRSVRPFISRYQRIQDPPHGIQTALPQGHGDTPSPFFFCGPDGFIGQETRVS